MKKIFQSLEERDLHRGWVQTWVTVPMHRWAKGLASNPGLPYGTALEMYTQLFVEFMTKKPWEQGLEWRRPHTTEGWKQVNIELGDVVLDDEKVFGSVFAQRIKSKAHELDVSTNVFCNTAVFYLTAYKHPPQKF